MPNPQNKTKWTPEMVEFMRRNFDKMSNQELATALGLRLTVTRDKLYKLGFKKMELQRWTAEQVEFLKANYKQMGDTELAQLFEARWEKDKGWSKKHIEKKRRQMKLKRTEAERDLIQKRNTEKGMFSVNHWKRWVKQAPLGTVKLWKRNGDLLPFIKTDKGYIRLALYMWEYHHGKVPEGMNIIHKDGNIMNCKQENLEMVSDSVLMVINEPSSKLTDRYVAGVMSHGNRELRQELLKRPDLIELKRTQLLLNRKIKNHEKQNE